MPKTAVGAADFDPEQDPTVLSHPAATNRLKDISDEMARLDKRATENDGRLSTEDEEYWGQLVREAELVDAHKKSLEREADKQRIIGLAGTSRGRLRVEAGSDGGHLDRDFLGEPDSIEDRKFRDPWDLSQMRTFDRTPAQVGAELRSRALAAIEIMPGMNQARREGATKIIEEFDNERGALAQLALYTSTPTYLRAFTKAARGQEKMLTAEEQEAVSRAMTLVTTAGGFLLPFQLDPTVIITSPGAASGLRSVARQVVGTSNIWNGVSSAAVAWSWDAEAAEVSDDATLFAGPAITVYKGAGYVPISIEALEDEQNVTQEVGRLLVFGKETLENTAFATGSGSAPQGIVTALAATASEINAAADDTFAIGDVYTIENALPARYRMNASWAANHSIYNLIRRFDTTGGASFWANLAGPNMMPQLLGRDAVELEAMDGVITTAGAVSNFILVYGDFSNYVIVDRIGTTVEFIPHIFSNTTTRPSGQRGWYAYFRMGADSVNDDAFRMLDVPSAA